MAQLSLRSTHRVRADHRFDLACTAQLRRLAREVKGLVFVAALETSTGRVLHSINGSADADIPGQATAVCQMIRSYQLVQAGALSVSPLVEIVLTKRLEVHVLRALSREPLVALYLGVQMGPGRATRARAALSTAAFVLDTLAGVA